MFKLNCLQDNILIVLDVDCFDKFFFLFLQIVLYIYFFLYRYIFKVDQWGLIYKGNEGDDLQLNILFNLTFIIKFTHKWYEISDY